MTIEDEDNYQNSNDCCICEKIINNKDKVRQHCYAAGEYKGPTHKECCKIPIKLPIIFHNLECYMGI